MVPQDGRMTTMTEHQIERPDGRTVAVRVQGPEDGPVVVLCQPAPGSRVLDPDPGATTAAGVRLVSLDRPGYGRSTPVPGGAVPSIPGAADDVAAALEHLGIGRAAVAGWSAGGRIALALAARRPELVSAVAVAATPAPQEDVPWIPPEHLALLDSLRGDPGAATGVLTGVFAEMAAMPPEEAAALVSGGPADEAVLAADPGLRDRLAAMLAEAMAQGAVGMAADIVSYTIVDWGFDPAAVAAPTTLVYGDADAVAGPAHGEWYASRVPGADLRVVAGAGHLVGITAWGEVLTALG
jgi:pimeloyl-ACP methyl ester carboxylesterase